MIDNYKKYLPSKKFATIALFVFTTVIIISSVKDLISFLRQDGGIGRSKIQVVETVEEKIQKDSNDNGIPDWEEYLWGLNPNKKGPENKEFILNKKKELTQKGQITPIDDSDEITENELLSRQFFATIVALQQTGELDSESINSISEAIGQSIEVSSLSDIYTESMLTKSKEKDIKKANDDYMTAFTGLVAKYQDQDMGGELTLISQGIINNDPTIMDMLRKIALSYRSFGKDLIEIPVPTSISIVHLNLANNYEKVAQSIEGLSKSDSDPIIGMRSIILYKKYTDALVSDINKISEVLQ